MTAIPLLVTPRMAAACRDLLFRPANGEVVRLDDIALVSFQVLPVTRMGTTMIVGKTTEGDVLRILVPASLDEEVYIHVGDDAE